MRLADSVGRLSQVPTEGETVKRTILLSLFAALALTIGFSSVAIAAGDGTAQAAKKKGKSCKKKKGKGKAGKSSTATAQAKKKGKKGCKKPKAPPKTPPQDEGLTEGRYADATNGVELSLIESGKGFYASVKFLVPSSCATFSYEDSQPSPAKSTGGNISVRGKGNLAVAGEPFDVSYSMSVTSTLEYKLTAEVTPKDSSLPCGYSGTIAGNLSRG
jgi:hypothetical protein